MSINVANGIARRLYELTGFTMTTLREPGRTVRYAKARQAIACVLRERTTWSFPQIARYVGRTDHSTVIHGRMKALETAKVNPDYAWFLDELREAEPCTTASLERAYGVDFEKLENIYALDVMRDRAKDTGPKFDQDGMNDDGETRDMHQAKLAQLAGNNAFLAALNAARAA